MRIFIALIFEDSAIAELIKLQDNLKDKYVGNYTKQENLHMTLAFLGDVDVTMVESLKTIVQNSFLDVKTLMANRVNMFQRNIAVVSFALCQELMLYQAVLVNNLKKKKFKLDNHPFVPHITIAREVNTKQNLNLAYERALDIKGIALMASTLTPKGSIYDVISFKKIGS